MPIEQSRILALVEIAESLISSREQLKGLVENLHKSIIDEIYSRKDEETPLVSDIVGKMYLILEAFSAPTLSEESWRILFYEREHHNLYAAKNARSKRRRQRKIAERVSQ